jgi:hypothetical protein
MTPPTEYAARPGNLGLSLITLAGLCMLGGLLWQVAAGYVILLLVPALLICGYQMVVTPTYGLRLAAESWTVLDGEHDLEIPAAEIAYLNIVPLSRERSQAFLVLVDGAEVPIPMALPAHPLDLIRDATARGVPVRSR